MALIVCPECNKKVSDTADVCPKCGFKLKVSSLGWLWAVGVFFISTAIGEVTHKPWGGVGAFIGLMIVFFIRLSKKSALKQKIEEANPVAEEPQVADEYENARPARTGKVLGPCFSCGAEIREGDQYCTDCGKKV